jgi:hypothetical protein
MTKVQMLKSIRGKVNGVPMGPYHAGKVYELDDERALLFAESQIAELLPQEVADTAKLAAAAGIETPVQTTPHDGANWDE